MDTSKLKNGKYFLGRFDKPNEFRGWFVGSFFGKGHLCKTEKVEVLYREHKKGDISVPYYHEQKVELLIMLAGKARCNVNGKEIILGKGNFLFIDINNIISAEFLQASKIFAIHSPSIPTDKKLYSS